MALANECELHFGTDSDNWWYGERVKMENGTCNKCKTLHPYPPPTGEKKHAGRVRDTKYTLTYLILFFLFNIILLLFLFN